MDESSLYDLYVKLKQIVPECKFSCGEPVSYINTLSDSTQKKYIFSYNSIAGNQAVLSPVISLNTTDSKDVSLIGNPLEDDCSIDMIEDNLNGGQVIKCSWAKSEETYSSVKVDEARSTLLHAAFHHPSCKSGSVWVLCDGNDYEKTILVEHEFIDNWNCRGAVYLKDFITFAKIDVNLLMAKHFSYLTGCQKLNTTVRSFFNIKSNMTLKFTQTTTSPNPLLNSYKKADIVLYQTVKIGGDNSRADEFWQQLMIICAIRDDILKYKSHEAKHNLVYTYGRYSEMKLNLITKEIEQILLDVAPCSFDESSETNVITAVLEKAKSRNHIDITDRLWMVLTSCSSYSDLKTALIHIFKFAAQCNIVNMPTNQNHLAELIREISQHRISIPSLTGTEPLELLLEIGLEKLGKDYEYIFSESKICGSNELNINVKDDTMKNATDVVMNVRNTLVKPSAGTQSNYRQTLMHRTGNDVDTSATADDAGFHNSKFDRKDVEQKLAKLAHIHLILEHLLLIQIHLSMENIYQSIAIQQLQKAAKPINVVKSMGEDKREIPIVIDKILGKIENVDPDALAIVMSSENKFKRIRNLFYYSVASIFPTNIYPDMEMNSKELTNAKQYCGLHYLRIETKSG